MDSSRRQFRTNQEIIAGLQAAISANNVSLIKTLFTEPKLIGTLNLNGSLIPSEQSIYEVLLRDDISKDLNAFIISDDNDKIMVSELRKTLFDLIIKHRTTLFISGEFLLNWSKLWPNDLLSKDVFNNYVLYFTEAMTSIQNQLNVTAENFSNVNYEPKLLDTFLEVDSPFSLFIFKKYIQKLISENEKINEKDTETIKASKVTKKEEIKKFIHNILDNSALCMTTYDREELTLFCSIKMLKFLPTDPYFRVDGYKEIFYWLNLERKLMVKNPKMLEEMVKANALNDSSTDTMILTECRSANERLKAELIDATQHNIWQMNNMSRFKNSNIYRNTLQKIIEHVDSKDDHLQITINILREINNALKENTQADFHQYLHKIVISKYLQYGFFTVSKEKKTQLICIEFTDAFIEYCKNFDCIAISKLNTVDTPAVRPANNN